jgi:hypothetical protein
LYLPPFPVILIEVNELLMADSKVKRRQQMPRRVSDAEFEKNMVKIFDEVIETGMPIEIERRGKGLIISPSEAQPKLECLEEHPGFIIGDPDSIVHLDWSEERGLGVRS